MGSSSPILDPPEDDSLTRHIQAGVIDVLEYWLSEGDAVRDILDDADLLARIHSFIRQEASSTGSFSDGDVRVIRLGHWWRDLLQAVVTRPVELLHITMAVSNAELAGDPYLTVPQDEMALGSMLDNVGQIIAESIGRAVRDTYSC